MAFIASLLIFLLEAFIVIILIRVIFSWVSPYPTNPVTRLAWQLTEPVLAPIRRLLPSTGGIDFSPMVAWIAAIILINVLRGFT
jgi:YggT family protein